MNKAALKKNLKAGKELIKQYHEVINTPLEICLDTNWWFVLKEKTGFSTNGCNLCFTACSGDWGKKCKNCLWGETTENGKDCINDNYNVIQEAKTQNDFKDALNARIKLIEERIRIKEQLLLGGGKE